MTKSHLVTRPFKKKAFKSRFGKFRETTVATAIISPYRNGVLKMNIVYHGNGKDQIANEDERADLLKDLVALMERYGFKEKVWRK